MTEKVEINTTPETPKKESLFGTTHFYKVTTIILGIFLISLLSIVYLQYKKTQEENAVTTVQDTSEISVSPGKKNSPTPPNADWNYEIVDTSTDKSIARFNSQNYYTSVAQWGNFLFYRPLQDPAESLNVYQLYTKESFAIDLKPYLTDRLTFNNFYVIGDELYISLGAYMAKGSLYYMPLPPKPDSKLTVVYEGANPEITKENGRYFIVGGEGDACWGERRTNLFDPITKEVTFLHESHYGCNDGEELLDYDKQNRMIIANHITSTEQSDSPINNLYTYVYAMPISSPGTKEMLLDEATMPKNITAVQFFKEKNKLILFGETSYVFDLATNELTKIVDIPKKLTQNVGQINWVDNFLCIHNYSTEEDILINMLTNEMDERNSCNYVSQPTPTIDYAQDQREKLQKQFDELSLPSTYSVTRRQ